MCETMINIPVEKKSSYILTEDMIDAAMNEQFAYENDIESEDELNSQEDIMEVDQGSQDSCPVENNENPNSVETTRRGLAESVIVNNKDVINTPSDSPTNNCNKMSVLVIETGLDKSSNESMKTAKDVQTGNANSAYNVDENCHTGSESVTAANEDTDKSAEQNKDPILKRILSDNKEIENDKIVSIDLCDSDGNNFSEDEDFNELIDDELRSVMENNLMAEIGMPVNKRTENENSIGDKASVEHPPENEQPKILVQNITQISSKVFNNLPQNVNPNMVSYLGEGVPTNSMVNVNKCGKTPNIMVSYLGEGVPTNAMINVNKCVNGNTNSNIPISDKNQGSNSIHINKIAVPHSNYVNSQVQKMKCVYVKNPNTLPLVINTTTHNLQTTRANENMKYMFTSQMKKPPIQMPAIAALKNLTKSIPAQRLVLPKSAKVLTVQQKLQRPPLLQNVPASSHQRFKYDHQNLDAVKTCLLVNAKPSYTPPNTFPENPTYSCVECNDKFLFQLSLSNHIDRRSISIRYWCHICQSDLQFYNRCALLSHLRGHNSSGTQIDYTCIDISPVPKEMIDKGITTTFMKENDSNSSLLKESTNHDGVNRSILINKNIANSKWKAVSLLTPNMPNHKVTTVAGQSKSICYQSPFSREASKPVSTVSSSQHSKKVLPLLLPKSVQAVSIVNSPTLQNQTKDHLTMTNKSQTNSVFLLCNNISKSPIQQNSPVNTTPPKAICEIDSRERATANFIDRNINGTFVDEDTSVGINNANEEEFVDVENIDENTTSSASVLLNSEPEKSSSSKKKRGLLSSNPNSRRQCIECGITCLNISKHLNGINRPTRLEFTCQICNLILPTKCALKIHTRIHMRTSPFKCPDCGKDFTAWDDLHSHLKFSCGHFAKCVRHMCNGCKSHFPSKSALTQHIVDKHGKDIFRCRLCPVAFYTKASIKKHILHEHSNEIDKCLELDYKQCDMCPKKLIPEVSFLSHVKEHTTSMIYGYKCSTCNIVFANKMAFIIHQIKERTENYNSEVGKSQNKTVCGDSMEELPQVSDLNSDLEDLLEEEKNDEYGSDSSTSEQDPLSLDGWEYSHEQKVKEKTKEPCIVCKKNSVVLHPGIDLNTQSLCCTQCVKPLNSDGSTLKLGYGKDSYDSFPKTHQDHPKNIQRSLSTNGIIKGTKTKRRTSDVSLRRSPASELYFEPFADSPPKKKSRKKQNNNMDLKIQSHIQGQVIKNKSSDLHYSCSKCEFVTDIRETFLEHITMHRTDPNTYQCLECGLCFVVLPSLERHLQMLHGIKDVKVYTENNKASLTQKVMPVQENQCCVCYKIFDSQLLLENHFRSHGMAYVNRLSK